MEFELWHSVDGIDWNKIDSTVSTGWVAADGLVECDQLFDSLHAFLFIVKEFHTTAFITSALTSLEVHSRSTFEKARDMAERITRETVDTHCPPTGLTIQRQEFQKPKSRNNQLHRRNISPFPSAIVQRHNSHDVHRWQGSI